MVDAEEQLLLLKKGHQARKVVSTALDLDMLPLGNVVNTNVEFVTTGRPTGNFLANEKVRVPPKTLSCIDGIVIGYSDQIQPLSLELLVEDLGWVIALATKTSHYGHGSHARMNGVDM